MVVFLIFTTVSDVNLCKEDDVMSAEHKTKCTEAKKGILNSHDDCSQFRNSKNAKVSVSTGVY
jgi:hypothetical protein